MTSQQTSTETLKKIIAIKKATVNKNSAFNIKQIIPGALNDVDPFVFLDHFGPFERDPNDAHFSPHPHAGIATISYLYSGTSNHVTSLGTPQIVKPGDVAWMRAGSGIEHAEGLREGQTEVEIFHGLQFWISLPAKDKFIKPGFFYYPKKDIPEIIQPGVNIKVVCGELFGKSSPAKSLTPAYIYDIEINENATIQIPVNHGYSCALFVANGTVICNGAEETADSIIKFDEENKMIEFRALKNTRVAVFGGQPLREPIIFHGPFVMNNKEQIIQVIRDYDNGKFGTINTGYINNN
jgi:quercetin 2,3-dioxygenase